MKSDRRGKLSSLSETTTTTTMQFFRKVSEDKCDEVVEWLSGASDPAAVVNEAADAAGNTALHLAAEKGSLAMVDVLIKRGAKLDVANASSGRNRRTVLHYLNVRMGLREGAFLMFRIHKTS